MSGSMRTCTSCQMQFKARSHRDRRYQCYVCKPDRRNASSQDSTRRTTTTNDALSRLSELEGKVESLSTQFEFYGNTIDTIRDSVIEELVRDTQDRVQQVSGQIIEKQVNKRITDFKEGMWSQMKAIEKKHSIEVRDMKEEMESMLMELTAQRVLITELKHELKGISSKMDAVAHKQGKIAKEKKKKAKGPQTRYYVGRAGLTKMQYDSLRRWCEQARTIAEMNHILPSEVRFDTDGLKKYSKAKAVPKTIRELVQFGLMRKYKVETPVGHRGARYRWSILPKCFTHDFFN